LVQLLPYGWRKRRSKFLRRAEALLRRRAASALLLARAVPLINYSLKSGGTCHRFEKILRELKMRKLFITIFVFSLLGAVSACNEYHPDLKSPCVGIEGSPCERHSPVNNDA